MKERGKTPSVAHSPPAGDEVLRQLDRILQSPPFHTSRRSQTYLRFVIEHALSGDIDRLKERCIGAELFGRNPDYDTGADSIVRVAANELRKKLAQFYLKAGPDRQVVIDLPAGTYVPEFRWSSDSVRSADGSVTEGSAIAPSTVPPMSSPPGKPARSWFGFRRASWRRVLLATALAGALALAALVLMTRSSRLPSASDQFWAPVLASPRPVLLCIGNPVVYLLSRRVHEEYQRTHPQPEVRGPRALALEDRPIPARDIVPVTDQFVGAGDALGLVHIVAALVRASKLYDVRTGADFSYSDLRSNPVIFIGFSNSLHLEMTKGLRFNFAVENGVKMIRDHVMPERSYRLPDIAPDGKTESDYALVSRVFDSETGQLLIQMAGITNYGTRAAGEFLANPARMEQAAASLPPNWSKNNVQIVLKTRVIGQSPTPPKVVAVHTW